MVCKTKKQRGIMPGTHRLTGLACALTLGMALNANAAQPAADGPRQYLIIDYAQTRNVRSQNDERTIDTRVSLSAGELSFVMYERVLGARTPTVQEHDYRSPFIHLTAVQQTTLTTALMQAGFDHLTSDQTFDGRETVRFSFLDPGHNYSYAFGHAVADDATRTAVVKALFDFVAQMGLDTSATGTATTSEGDTAAARPVTIAKLVAHPDLYDGKRVSVAGYYHTEFEASDLCDRKPQLGLPAGSLTCLWQGEASTFADPSALTGRNDSWERIEGVFVKGPNGHMGLYPGQIDRVTRSETVPALQ